MRKWMAVLLGTALLCTGLTACMAGDTAAQQPADEEVAATGEQNAEPEAPEKPEAEPEPGAEAGPEAEAEPLAGEAGEEPADEQDGEAPVLPDAGSLEGALVETTYGSYTLPGGWYQLEEISTPDKPFYVKEGLPTDSAITNISVEYGSNRYALDEHMEFRMSIQQQLAMQAEAMGIDMSEGFEGSGRTTEVGNVLYVFALLGADVDTVQYYIVGEQCYVLIYITDFHDERIPDAREVADAIADSFEWA